jgi:hypothetical protein
MEPTYSEHVKACVGKALSALDEIDLDNDAVNALKVGSHPVPAAAAAASNLQNPSALPPSAAGPALSTSDSTPPVTGARPSSEANPATDTLTGTDPENPTTDTPTDALQPSPTHPSSSSSEAP